MNVGEYLKSEREKKGLTIDHIAFATKISPMHLGAIESDRLDMLPSRVFVRGFLRSYAKELGLDPEAIILMYEESATPVNHFAFSAVRRPLAAQPKKIKIHVSGTVVFLIIAVAVIALAALCSMR